MVKKIFRCDFLKEGTKIPRTIISVYWKTNCEISMILYMGSPIYTIWSISYEYSSSYGPYNITIYYKVNDLVRHNGMDHITCAIIIMSMPYIIYMICGPYDIMRLIQELIFDDLTKAMAVQVNKAIDMRSVDAKDVMRWASHAEGCDTIIDSSTGAPCCSKCDQANADCAKAWFKLTSNDHLVI